MNSQLHDSEVGIAWGVISAYKNKEQEEEKQGKKRVQQYPEAAWSHILCSDNARTRLQAAFWTQISRRDKVRVVCCGAYMPFARLQQAALWSQARTQGQRTAGGRGDWELE
ncbi:hypothetical protein J6590_054355 [Homalodisca vitripennis]|nr:hypothetical protein J6590_054355 [Homalodisca vitripennis]